MKTPMWGSNAEDIVFWEPEGAEDATESISWSLGQIIRI